MELTLEEKYLLTKELVKSRIKAERKTISNWSNRLKVTCLATGLEYYGKLDSKESIKNLQNISLFPEIEVSVTGDQRFTLTISGIKRKTGNKISLETQIINDTFKRVCKSLKIYTRYHNSGENAGKYSIAENEIDNVSKLLNTFIDSSKYVFKINNKNAYFIVK